MAASRPRDLAWIAGPFAVYLLVLQRLWFDAPVSDDFLILLRDVMRMLDAQSLWQWLGIAAAQHNEHRVAVVRVAAWALALVTGHIDFRALVLLGNLTVLGIALLAWAEFRHVVAAPLFAAAALLLFQWTYYEASLMASAALPNLGVVFFSFACLFCALRGGGPTAAACVAFGLLAVGSQANGLFALPLAAAACTLTGRRGRAWVFAVVAVALWIAYFLQYYRPAQHPVPFVALADPLSAMRFFLNVIGGMVPGDRAPTWAGATIVVALAWLAWRGVWRSHPTAALWTVFVLVSAAAATAGRLGLGMPQSQSSRYAIYSSCLVVICFLAIAARSRPWTRVAITAAVLASALVAVGVSWLCWLQVTRWSVAGGLLARAEPASPEVIAQRYLWTFSDDPRSRDLLAEAERRGLYSPRKEILEGAALQSTSTPPSTGCDEGKIDHARASGNHVILDGWSPVGARVPREFTVFAGGPTPSRMQLEVIGRPDLAVFARDPGLFTSGYRLQLEFVSAGEAARAIVSPCVVVKAVAR